MQGERANVPPIFFQPKDSFLGYWDEEGQKIKIFLHMKIWVV
jgi:hypothetical protein